MQSDNSNKQTDNDTVMTDIKDPKLSKALATVEKLKADMELKTENLEAAVNDNMDPDVMATHIESLTEADQRYERVKAFYARNYHNEVAFKPAVAPIQVSTNEASNAPATILPGEIPALATEDDKLDTPIGQVHTNVATFITHFEKLLKVKGCDVNTEYGNYLDWSLGTSYAIHINQKRQSLKSTETETWQLVKEWLKEFNDTPAQRLRNLNGILRIQWNRRDSSEKFATTYRDIMEQLGADKFTVAELVAALAVLSTPYKTQIRFKEVITPVLAKGKSSVTDMTKVFQDMDISADLSDKRRHNEVEPHIFKSRNNDATQATAPTATPAAPTGGGVWCGNGCGQKYLPRHNEVCPNYKKPATNDAKPTHANKRFARDRPSKINRAARKQQPPMHPDRQMAIRHGRKEIDHIDEITDSLCYTGISSDDPIDKIQCKSKNQTQKQSPDLINSHLHHPNVFGVSYREMKP
ncbi:hypothetical protein [Absidia glauca]|uniref:Uncharacterized protein n=1 Tax=Absidia glauca TaxID=4829 RepID=A0A168QF72_ABSGL|nr:hypothetical protein [Absidia glauca]